MNYIEQLAVDVWWEAEQSPDVPSVFDMPLYRIYALLVLTKSEAVTAENVHDAWAVWTATTKPDHRSLVPFDQLSPEVQVLDEPYVEAIRRVARQRTKVGRKR